MEKTDPYVGARSPPLEAPLPSPAIKHSLSLSLSLSLALSLLFFVSLFSELNFLLFFFIRGGFFIPQDNDQLIFIGRAGAYVGVTAHRV